MTQNQVPQEATVIIAVSEIDPVSTVFAKRLTSHGFKVRMADSMDALRDVVHEVVPDVVLLEGWADYASSVRRWAKKIHHEKVPSLFALHREGFEPGKEDGLKVIADEYLVEPYEVEEVCRLIEAEYARVQDERQYITHSFTLQASATEEDVSAAADFVERASKHYGVRKDLITTFSLALREALDNAMRLGCKENPSNKIRLNYILTKNALEVYVTDPGEGFDTASLLKDGLDGDAVKAARSWRKEQSSVGLGMLIMANCVEDVEYSKAGNTVRLRQHLGNPNSQA